MESFRYLTSDPFDIDAFLLVDQRWIFFISLKDPRLIKKNNFEKMALEFPHGHVVGMAGAIKTKKISKPLPWRWFGDEASIPKEFWCLENSLKYRLEVQGVLNPGLFLDQAINRKHLGQWIQSLRQRQDADIHVLNLFSYTGSFSVVASCAGATHTTSVDLSNRYLKWEKKNHEANNETNTTHHHYICEDVRSFLKKAIKRKSRYHCIILDPPTFSRAVGSVFQVQKEFFPMLENAIQCLVPGGIILASTNDASWNSDSFFSQIEKIAKDSRLSIERGDFPRVFKQHCLKSVWLYSA